LSTIETGPWYGAVILIFTGIYFISEVASIGGAERTSAYVLAGTLLVLGAIWQAAGLTIARVHMLLSGITLEEALDQRPPEVMTGF
jgi:hypothetical protein